MHPADLEASADLHAEPSRLRTAMAPTPSRASERFTRAAIASAALVPTVLGAIAAGAAEAPAADPQGPTPSELRPERREAHLVAPVQRVRVLPLTPEHKPLPAGTDFSFNPRFKAMIGSQRGLPITTGTAARATLYRVAPGDSLYAIARALLGNGNRWRELYAANRGKLRSPSVIRVGMTLTIPTPLDAPRPGARYQVAQGDSLYAIAARALNNPQRWREIAALNKAQLRGGTTIHPRQVLLIPQV